MKGTITIRLMIILVPKNTLTVRRLYLYMKAGLPWHIVDDVYIPVNCDGRFHWVLAVVELKRRLICVYDSSLGSRKKYTLGR
ncbi:hypothetical protein H5410_022391 [Solanum commersonii]|uniref:Ubiquitin-like protease family profile domain-containing protein n=1 Tax=Solanum commersonii TaxID=4109 RepID=A0A9J5ZJ83_SOLCO|nr:hypothetical protein H5410_022391 [Solanum commersonii]